MKTSRFAAGCATILGLSLVAGHARAVCQDTPAATDPSDFLQAFINNNPCGNPNLSNDQRTSEIAEILGDFDMVSDDWGNRGTATCAPSFGQQGMSTEVAKFFNAAFLFVGGVNFTRSQNPGFVAIGAQSFHGSDPNQSSSADYWNLTIAQSSGWHNWFRDQVDDRLANATFGDFDSRGGIGIPDLIRTTCTIYDYPFTLKGRIASTTPLFRATTIVHEAWHAWENIHSAAPNTSCGHSYCPGDHSPNPPPGSNVQKVSSVSCFPGAECDIWYPHPQGACPQVTCTGAHGGCDNSYVQTCLNNGDEGYMVSLMHRPWQVENELACDIANTPQGWVPLVVRELAASNADFYETMDSVNGTDPANLGATQPACYALDFGVHYAICGSGTQCDEASPCASGFCNPQSGCCQSTPPVCRISGRATCDGTCVCDQATNCCSPATL